MGLGCRVKAYILLLIMLLLSLHDLIPHTHYLDSNFSSFIVLNHFHSDHDYGHHHGDKAHDHDQSEDDQEHSLLDFLLGEHQQTSHLPQLSTSDTKTPRSHLFVVYAILPETFQLPTNKRSFLHHYSLFDPDFPNPFSFLADFNRRGPPIFIS